MDNFRVVPEYSRVWISGQTSVHQINIKADGLTGELALSVADDELVLSPLPSGRWELPIRRLKAGSDFYDGELQRRVQAKQFPTITGEIRDCQASWGAGTYRFRGDLTFHGVTRSVDGEVLVRFPDRNTVEFIGEQTFDIRDFGLRPPRVFLLHVYPTVKVRLRLVAERVLGNTKRDPRDTGNTKRDPQDNREEQDV